jgi:hypothetical protein
VGASFADLHELHSIDNLHSWIPSSAVAVHRAAPNARDIDDANQVAHLAMRATAGVAKNVLRIREVNCQPRCKHCNNILNYNNNTNTNN